MNLVLPDNYVQLSAVITRSNIVWYCINNCRNSSRISIRIRTHKRHLIPLPDGRAMGCILWIFVRTPHCIRVCKKTRHDKFQNSQIPKKKLFLCYLRINNTFIFVRRQAITWTKPSKLDPQKQTWKHIWKCLKNIGWCVPSQHVTC